MPCVPSSLVPFPPLCLSLVTRPFIESGNGGDAGSETRSDQHGHAAPYVQYSTVQYASHQRSSAVQCSVCSAVQVQSPYQGAKRGRARGSLRVFLCTRRFDVHSLPYSNHAPNMSVHIYQVHPHLTLLEYSTMVQYRLYSTSHSTAWAESLVSDDNVAVLVLRTTGYIGTLAVNTGSHTLPGISLGSSSCPSLMFSL